MNPTRRSFIASLLPSLAFWRRGEAATDIAPCWPISDHIRAKIFDDPPAT